MSSPDLPLRWVKPPRQDRSRDTQLRYVEAAQRLLARGRAWDQLGVAELAKEAGSSVGAFYARFRDKDALLHVLQLELNREGSATGAETFRLAAAATLPLDALVRGFVTLAVSYYRQQFGLRRALLVEMAGNAELRARATELSRETCDGLIELLRPRFPKVARARLRDVVDVAHRMVYGTLDQVLLFGAGGTPTGHVLDDARLIDELSCAIHAYLAARLPAR
jgi:AcrR family transcriptional regulator